MSVHAGNIVHVGGNNVIDRLQSAGLGDVQIPIDVVRETGNREIVGKVPGDPDFTFSLESWDVSTEIEAWLTGGYGAIGGSATAPGFTDADGTEYDLSTTDFVNITSPWTDEKTGSAGVVTAGHLIPGYAVTRVRYAFGVTDNASETVDLAGGSYYYNGNAPVEQREAAGGTVFTTDDPAVPYRIGGADGTSFKSIFGVILDGELQTEGVDYTQSPSNTAVPGTATLTMANPVTSGQDLRFCYFTTAAQALPQPVHASTIVKPAAVRGRHICVYLGDGVDRKKVGGTQALEVEFTVDSTVDREMCNEEPVGRTINGFNTTGTLTVRSKDKDAFLALAAEMVGVDVAEVIGYLNTHQIPLTAQILNPKNPAQVLKTLRVPDAVFQIPGTAARVNQPTDFAFRFESDTGVLRVIKGAG